MFKVDEITKALLVVNFEIVKFHVGVVYLSYLIVLCFPYISQCFWNCNKLHYAIPSWYSETFLSKDHFHSCYFNISNDWDVSFVLYRLTKC